MSKKLKAYQCDDSDVYAAESAEQAAKLYEEMVGELFAFWMQHPEDLPQSYRSKAESEPLARIVCDYIAGMTDNFIIAQHERYAR